MMQLAGECLSCGGTVFTPQMVSDGDQYSCADCGDVHQVMCDTETAPYLVRAEEIQEIILNVARQSVRADQAEARVRELEAELAEERRLKPTPRDPYERWGRAREAGLNYMSALRYVAQASVGAYSAEAAAFAAAEECFNKMCGAFDANDRSEPRGEPNP